jgi:hypothetical protein
VNNAYPRRSTRDSSSCRSRRRKNHVDDSSVFQRAIRCPVPTGERTASAESIASLDELQAPRWATWDRSRMQSAAGGSQLRRGPSRSSAPARSPLRVGSTRTFSSVTRAASASSHERRFEHLEYSSGWRVPNTSRNVNYTALPRLLDRQQAVCNRAKICTLDANGKSA